MSIINRFLSAVTEPEFKLARDLTAMVKQEEHNIFKRYIPD